MKITRIAKFVIGASTSLLVAACATTGGEDVTMQSQYERTIPVCVGASDCHVKMNAARDWVANNTGLQLLVNTEDRLETGGWGMPHYTAVRVDRASIGADRYWILVETNCGSDGRPCLPYWESAIDFNQVVGAAN